MSVGKREGVGEREEGGAGAVREVEGLVEVSVAADVVQQWPNRRETRPRT